MAAENKERYFNFPIQLLDGFLIDSKTCLNNIIDYAIYSHSLVLEFGDDEFDLMKASASFFNVSLGSVIISYENGKELFNSIEEGSPKVGLNVSIFWDFYKNSKSEFEKVTLLAFLAIKSIIGKKPYWKVTNNYWLSRMDGKVKSVQEEKELTNEIRKYATEYQTKKIKKHLHLYWGLKDYSRYTRGFYVSFKLSLEQLVYVAEKRRETTKERAYKHQQQEALKKALQKLKENGSK